MRTYYKNQPLSTHNDDDSEESEGFELDADLPSRRQENHEEFRIKADIPPFNDYVAIENFLDWVLSIF